MQEYLGMDHPMRGGYVPGQLVAREHHLRRPASVAPRGGVRDRRPSGVDLPPCAPTVRPEDMAQSVAASMAAIEVVEDRYLDYSALDAPTLIADDFFHHSCVLGPEVEEFDPHSLRTTNATMFVNDEPVGSGRGDQVMGDPLTALTWLANNCFAWGRLLRAGDIVLLGSVVGPIGLSKTRNNCVNDRLGEVRASFARPD